MHVGSAGTHHHAASNLHAQSCWHGHVCRKPGLLAQHAQQARLQQGQTRPSPRGSSKVQALHDTAACRRGSAARHPKPFKQQQQQQQQKQKQQRRQPNTQHAPSWRPTRSARAKRVPLPEQIEQLLAECEAHQHWALTRGSQHLNQGQGKNSTCPSAGQEALSRLLRLSELCSLWDTAQGQAARQQALAASPPAAESPMHTAKTVQPHDTSRRASSAHAPNATQFVAPGISKQGAAAAGASCSQAPGEHAHSRSPSIPAPPDLPARMGVCADHLLEAIALHVCPSPTPSSPSPATLLHPWSLPLTPSVLEGQTNTPSRQVPIPGPPCPARLAPSPHNSTPTDRIPHTTLTHVPCASLVWDIESASQLAHAMAATQRYHVGLCAHVERAAVQHVVANGRMEIRCAARIMAAWAKLGHVPSQASLVALLHASGTAMDEMAASLPTTPAVSLPQAPPSSALQPPIHTPKLQASGQAIAPAAAPAFSQATAPAQLHKLQASGRAVADLAWAASQLNTWGSRRGSGSGGTAGRAGLAAPPSPPPQLPWVDRVHWGGAGGRSYEGSRGSGGTDRTVNKIRSPTGDVGWGRTASPAAPLNAALLLLPSHRARPSAPAVAASTTATTTTIPTPINAKVASAEAADDGFDSRGLQATSHHGAVTPLDLARAQQAWLDALQRCSLPHLPALNLAGLGRLLRAAAAMHMHPCSQAWLQSAAASLLAATPELHAPPAPYPSNPQLPPLPSHTPPPHPTSTAAAPSGQLSQPCPAPSSAPTQPPALSSALLQPTSPRSPLCPPPLGISSLHCPQPLPQPPPPPPLTGPRLASLTDAALGLAELWAGLEVFRSARGRRDALHLLPGSNLEACRHACSSLDAAVRAGFNQEPAPRIGFEKSLTKGRHGKGEEEVQQGVPGSSVGGRGAGGASGETGPNQEGVRCSGKGDTGSGAGSMQGLSSDGSDGTNMACHNDARVWEGVNMPHSRGGHAHQQTSAAGTAGPTGSEDREGIGSEVVPEGAALADLQKVLARLFSPQLLPHMGSSHLAPLLWASAALGAGPYISPQGVHLAMEQLHGHLPTMCPPHLVYALHAAAMLRLRPYRAWMADWQQQLLRHAPALSCVDSVRVVCSLAVLLPPATKIGAPVTAALVNRLSHHLPAMNMLEVSLSLAAIRRLYRRLSGRPLQRLVHAMEDRLQFTLC